MKSHFFFGVWGAAALLVALLGQRGRAALGNDSLVNQQEYAVAASSFGWSAGPSNHYRLFVDFYNTSDFFDSEPKKDKERFPDLTELSDTLRPVLTLLWVERFRFQAGVIGQRIYGQQEPKGTVDPWLQVLWKPTSSLMAVLGDLSIPHDYLPAIFYRENYFQRENREQGLQLLHEREGWRDDLFFNFRQYESPATPEKMDLGYVHYNEWRWLNFTYQADFTHTGGDNFPHAFNTITDSAQAAGVGLKFHPVQPAFFGGSYHYIHSHHRIDAGSNSALNLKVNGDGHLITGYLRWSRLKLTFGSWHSSTYSHENGDPYYNVPVMEFLEAHFDILVIEDFKLFGELTGYFIGNNNSGLSHYVKPTGWLEAAWHFAIPSRGWSIGEPEAAETVRWDNRY